MARNNRLKKLEDAAGGSDEVEVIYVDWNEGDENTFVNFVKPASMKGVRMTVAEFRVKFPDAYATRLVVNYVEEPTEKKVPLFEGAE